MRILVAPDKFKGSLGAAEVAAHITAGLRDGLPGAQISESPVADGGEGTAAVICAAAGGDWHTCAAHDAVGNAIEARYCTLQGGVIAVMEMSEAAGLWRVSTALRNPETASSFGVGEMLRAAAERGVQRIIVGLGGSATNDGGFGMARALGFRFLDAQHVELGDSASELVRLHEIEAPAELRLPPMTAAVDVQNPLLGEDGATRSYGPQKGANAEQVLRLERALERLADVVARKLGSDAREVPGSGAAGGLAFGLIAFCGASVRLGFEVVAERIGLEAAVRDADVVITGEGRLDAQTLQGKAPAGVARLARKFRKRTYAIVGELAATAEAQELFDDVVVARPADMSHEEALRNASMLLRDAGRRLAARIRQLAHDA